MEEVPEDTFVSIDGGGHGYCGRSSAGEVRCWGDEAEWGSFIGGDVREYSVGDYATCTLDDAGFATCVGDDFWSLPYPAVIPTDLPFQRIGPSFDGACVLTTEGEIECYVNGAGDWGLGPPTGAYVDLAIGWDEGCGLTVEGGAICWGLGTDAPGVRFTSLSAGHAYACGVTDSAAIKCWPEWTSTPEEYTSEWYADKVTSSYPRTGAYVSVDSSSSVSIAVTTEGQVVIFGNWDQETYAEAWFTAHPEE